MKLMGIIFLGLFGCRSADVERGGVGETCRARNDCERGLACLREVCVLDNSSLNATSKSCDRVECAAAGDCCTDFVPDSGCPDYDAACQANPDDCLAFETLCKCNRDCTDSLCVDTSPECIIDSHCPWFDRTLCVDRKCVECRSPADCSDSTNLCVSGACIPRCTSDSECPLLHTCVDSQCSPTGCTTDRECSFVLGTPDAVCDDHECAVACRSNTECDVGAFEVCRNERCVFVGCQTDAECRAYLDIENTDANVTAVCR